MQDNFSIIEWQDYDELDSKKYICGYCGNSLASDKGYLGTIKETGNKAGIYICHYCNKPTFFDGNYNQYPGVIFGKNIGELPENVEKLYNEARSCIGSNAYTASVMCSRKLLMNISVSLGAEEGKKFQYYVGWLIDEGHISKSAKDWVDHIRLKGNEAVHEISLKSEEEAEELILFLENILESIYEFPAKLKKKEKNSQIKS